MDTPAVFDLERVLAGLDGDRELFLELAGIFLTESPRELAAAQAALGRGDANGLVAAAHRLKGSVLQFCARSVLESATRLEELGRKEDLISARSVCVAMETQLSELHQALRCVLIRNVTA